MNRFEIIIEFSENIFKQKTKREVMYVKNKYDTITFEGDKIIINGQRTKKIDLEKCLKTAKSNYRRTIIVALLYTYFSYGKITIASSKIIVGHNSKINELDFIIKNRFIEECHFELRINRELESFFIDDIRMVSLFIKAMSYLNLSISSNDQKFSNSWKSLNSLLSYFSEERSDAKKIESIISVMESNFTEFKRVNKMCDEITCEDLEKCFTNNMLLNNFSSKNKNNENKILKFITGFSDERVCSLLAIKMTTLKDQIKDYERELENIKNRRDEKTKNNMDIVKFMIFKYAYYLRCIYFHAEKIEAEYLFENDESDEMKRISEYIQIVVVDTMSYIASKFTCEGMSSNSES